MEARKHITWEDLGGGSGVGCVCGGGGALTQKMGMNCNEARKHITWEDLGGGSGVGCVGGWVGGRGGTHSKDGHEL